MDLRIALAGNPNSGKTTLFNALTGSNQFVGNWPGVTVEKKEGKLKGHDGVIITDLPGIYSLSPYTLEEVVARNYLIGTRPDAILNIIDGTNLERNLYLTTQLTELGIPVVLAVNMMDVVRKNGDKIDVAELSRRARLPGRGGLRAEGRRRQGSRRDRHQSREERQDHPDAQVLRPGRARHRPHRRGCRARPCPKSSSAGTPSRCSSATIRCLSPLNIPADVNGPHRAGHRRPPRRSSTTTPRASSPTSATFISPRSSRPATRRKTPAALTSSDKIDKIVTNRWLGLPIFAVVMFLVYWIAMVTVGAPATDWANDGLFGDGWHLFGIGSAAYNEVAEQIRAGTPAAIVDGYDAYVEDKRRRSRRRIYLRS